MQSAQLQLVSLWAHDCMHTCIWGAAWSEGGAAVAVHSYLFERYIYYAPDYLPPSASALVEG